MRRILAVCLLLCALPALADRNDFDIEYFIVQGSTAPALRAELNARGPVGETRGRSDGYTRWHIDWTYGFDVREGACTATNIVVDLDIHMILPRWYPPAGAREELVGRWNRFLVALRVHEDGHRWVSEAAARDIRRVLLAEPGAGDCRTLENRLNSKGNALLEALRAKQDAYDRDTARGKTQGVRFP